MSLKDKFFISDASRQEGQTVTLQGWVYNTRSAGKKLRFLIARDGTGFMQCVFFKEECEEDAFSLFDGLTQESAVEVTGIIKREPRSIGGWEMGARSLKLVSTAESYPISNKEHGVEFLMENRHLWVRSRKQWAALRIRSEIIWTIHQFYHDRDYVRFDAPVLSGSACEGSSTLFETKYFEQQAYLSQSGQLYGEVGAMAFRKIYVYGPTFRAEKSKTRKHLTEFWMVEPEMAYADLEDAMDLGQEFVEHIVLHVLEKCQEELNILERNFSELKKIKGPFPRISYDEALEILKKKNVDLKWGEDFGAPHETALSEEFDKPVYVHHMPSQIKAFYFKQSDTVGGPGVKNKTGKYALGCDLIAPGGYGEIIGGGQREEDTETLLLRLKEHDLDEKDYYWYLDLRRFGSVPHSGFGLGIERMVAWVTGVSHVRETIPFPRMLNTLKP